MVSVAALLASRTMLDTRVPLRKVLIPRLRSACGPVIVARWGSRRATGLIGSGDHGLELRGRDADRTDAKPLGIILLRMNDCRVERDDGDVGGDEVVGEADYGRFKR
jgi:hypothetical protein